MIKPIIFCTLLFGLTNHANATENEFFVREDINKLNIRTDVNNANTILTKVEDFVTKNQEHIDDNMFIIECYSSRCENYAKEIKSEFLRKGKSSNYIKTNSMPSKLGKKYDMVFKLVKYKVMKPNCKKLSVMSFDDDWYNVDTSKNEYDTYCTSLYLDTLSSKNLGNKLDLERGAK